MVGRYKLTDRQCRSAGIGLHGDGNCLYLDVTSPTARSWLFICRDGDKRTELGLGSYPAVSLAQARDKAAQLQAARAQGLDPKRARDARHERSITFGQCAEQMLADLEPGWSSARHRYQFRRSLTVEAVALAGLPIADISTEDVLRLFQPLWLTRPDGARRLQRRIEKLFDYAKARRYRTGENPARWRGHLAVLLAKQPRSQRHHAAMPYQDVPAFLSEVRRKGGYGARGLELLILTAVRSGEMIGARWDEFDLERREWTIPGERMKSRLEHRVPLSEQAIAVLAELRSLRRGDYVLPSHDASRHASDALLDHVVKRSGRRVTVHGFRSSFRDFAAERTTLPREVAEMALAHQVGSATERAYARSDLFQRRAHLMQLWAQYCTEQSGKVIKLQR